MKNIQIQSPNFTVGNSGLTLSLEDGRLVNWLPKEAIRISDYDDIPVIEYVEDIDGENQGQVIKIDNPKMLESILERLYHVSEHVIKKLTLDEALLNKKISNLELIKAFSNSNLTESNRTVKTLDFKVRQQSLNFNEKLERISGVRPLYPKGDQLKLESVSNLNQD